MIATGRKILQVARDQPDDRFVQEPTATLYSAPIDRDRLSVAFRKVYIHVVVANQNHTVIAKERQILYLTSEEHIYESLGPASG